MAENLLTNTIIGFSSAVETTINTIFVTAAGYTFIKTLGRQVPNISKETFDDAGAMGNQGTGPSIQYVGFINSPAWEIQDVVNTNSFANFCRRFFGTADPTPAGGDIIEASKVFRHKFRWIDPATGTVQLPSTSWLWSTPVAAGGVSNIWGGVCGNTLNISQSGGDNPQYNMGMAGTGYVKPLSDYPGFGSASKPTAVDQMCGGDSAVTYNDGSARNITSTHRLVNISVTANNALNTGDKRAGASKIVPADPTKGWYLDYLVMTDNDASGEFTVTVDASEFEQAAADNNTIITAFKWSMKGLEVPTTAADNQYGVDVHMAKAYFRAPNQLGEHNNLASKTFGVFPVLNTTHTGRMAIDVINGQATSIV